MRENVRGKGAPSIQNSLLFLWKLLPSRERGTGTPFPKAARECTPCVAPLRHSNQDAVCGFARFHAAPRFPAQSATSPNSQSSLNGSQSSLSRRPRRYTSFRYTEVEAARRISPLSVIRAPGTVSMFIRLFPKSLIWLNRLRARDPLASESNAGLTFPWSDSEFTSPSTDSQIPSTFDPYF